MSGEQYPTRAAAPTGPSELIRDRVSQVVNGITPARLPAGGESRMRMPPERRVHVSAGRISRVGIVAAGGQAPSTFTARATTRITTA